METITPSIKRSNIKRSKKKTIQVFGVFYCYRYKLSGEMQDIKELLGLYYTREAAVHDLIAMLNTKYSASIEYSEESLETWMERYSSKSKELYKIRCEWKVEPVDIDDKEKILERKEN